MDYKFYKTKKPKGWAFDWGSPFMIYHRNEEYIFNFVEELMKFVLTMGDYESFEDWEKTFAFVVNKVAEKYSEIKYIRPEAFGEIKYIPLLRRYKDLKK